VRLKKLASQYISNTKKLKTLEAETTMSSRKVTNEYLVTQHIVREELMPQIPPSPLFVLLLLTCTHPLQNTSLEENLK